MGIGVILVSALAILSPAFSRSVEYRPTQIILNENINIQPMELARRFSSLTPNFARRGEGSRRLITTGASPSHTTLVPAPESVKNGSIIKCETEDQEDKHSENVENVEIVNIMDVPVIDNIQLFTGLSWLTPNMLQTESQPQTELFEAIPMLQSPEVIIEEDLRVKLPTINTVSRPFVEVISEAVFPTSASLVTPVVTEDTKIEKAANDSIEQKVTKNIIDECSSASLPPAPTVQELEIIPEAPVLPPITLDIIPPIITEEINVEEVSYDSVEQINMLPELPVPEIIIELGPITEYFEFVPQAPLLPTISLGSTPPIIVKDINIEKPGYGSLEQAGLPSTLPKPVMVEAIVDSSWQSKPLLQEFEIIPEAPVLPPIIIENIKIEEPFYESIKEIKLLPEISVPEIVETVVEENFGSSNPVIEEIEIIPEAPILPPISAEVLRPLIIEEPSYEAVEGIEVFPAQPVPEMVEVFDEENYFDSMLSDLLPIDTENKPVIQELELMPETPVLPPVIIEDIKIELSPELSVPEIVEAVVEENFGSSNPVIEEIEIIPEAPILPPISADVIRPVIIEEPSYKAVEGIKVFLARPMPEMVEVFDEKNHFGSMLSDFLPLDTEIRPVIQELELIPEAPMLRPVIIENIKIEEPSNESVEQLVLLPDLPIPEVEIVEESFSGLIDNEAKPVIIEVIPEAPVLPPISLDIIPTVITEDIKIEEPAYRLIKPIEIVPQLPNPDFQEPKIIPEAPFLPSFAPHLVITEEIERGELSHVVSEPTELIIEETFDAQTLPSYSNIIKIMPESPKSSEVIAIDEPRDLVVDLIRKPIRPEETIKIVRSNPRIILEPIPESIVFIPDISETFITEKKI